MRVTAYSICTAKYASSNSFVEKDKYVVANFDSGSIISFTFIVDSLIYCIRKVKRKYTTCAS